jgi:glycosidase
MEDRIMQAWWDNAVVYQIYPRSFQDTDGDGIGDLKGIMKRLPYLKDLGITAIWMTPIYPSPMVDNGYDISDYENIDPLFGSLEDFDRLVEEAHKLDIKIIMDLVLNHTSAHHTWFQDVLKNPSSPYRDYYIIKPAVEGRAPNNWRSNFGGSAWKKIPGRDEFYLHIFAKEQSDLNWENPAMRKSLYKMINAWIDRGVDGFRIDAINFIKKNQAFPNLPADAADGLANPGEHSLNAQGIGSFLQELKEEALRNGAVFTVAEANGVRPEQLEEFVGRDGYFTAVFDFSYTDMDLNSGFWYDLRLFTPKELRENIFKSELTIRKTGSLGAPYIENHDQNRSSEKFLKGFSVNVISKSAINMMYFFLQGVPFIYQGQEIGMENYPWKNLDQFNDVSTKGQYDQAVWAGYDEDQAFDLISSRARDNARTPMQWDASQYAGFSQTEPWLPVNPNHDRLNVRNQQEDNRSFLHFFKTMIQVRKDHAEVFARGDFVPAFEDYEDIIAYLRKREDHTLMVLINFSETDKCLSLGDRKVEVLLDNYEFFKGEKLEIGQSGDENTLKLQAFQALVLDLN